MLERGVLTMSSTARTSRQRSPPQPPHHHVQVDNPGCDSSDLLSNPSYDIIASDVGQFTTQYYHTVEPSENILSPKDGGGSSSDSSSSRRSKTSSTSSDEGESSKILLRRGEHGSPMSDDVLRSTGVPQSLEYVVQQPSPQKVAISMCGSISGHGPGETSAVKHWSYEEQFKQLYNLSPEPERKEFLDKLFDYMQKKGSPITRVPIMAKQPLDLYRLYKLVVERGGLVEVIKKKAWRAVAKELNLPASITSAAFTMRSQYVKYLYPYECEVENLSDPQELQQAIDTHKRDRRQSDTTEFLHQSLPTARSTLDGSLTPVTNTITTPQGLQILSSPTVALPHGAIPPYSGSFIVTGPGGAQMVTPQISGGPPHLVQMTTTPHGIPIMVPALAQKHDISNSGGGGAGEDRDDASSQASSEASDRESSAPPPKRVAVDIGGRTIAATRIPSVQTAPTPTGFMMTPSRHIVPTSHLTSPHVVMGHNSHIPIVMPTTTATGFLSPQTSSPIETAGIPNGIIVKDDGARRSPLENGGCSPRLVTAGTGKPTQVIPGSHLLHMNQHSHSVPLVLPSNAIPAAAVSHHHGNPGIKHRPSSESLTTVMAASSSSHSTPSSDHTPHTSLPTATEKPHGKHNGGIMTPQINSAPSSLKMPFANISIQSANKDGDGSDSTLLVTMEINDTVFQGVLFAKPTPATASSSSPSR